MDHGLTRPPDGPVTCCICFDLRWPDQLFVDGRGDRWDLCADTTCPTEAGWRDGTWPEDRRV